MAINAVDYVKPSSTETINAQYADENNIPKAVPIKSNANAIRKDADQGNCELTTAQEKMVDGNVDYDTLDYSEEEMGKVGEQQIDTKAEDGEDLSEKDQKAGSNVAIAAAATGAAASAALCLGLGDGKSGSGGWVGLAISIAQLAAAGTCFAFSIPSVFDPNISERESQMNSAAQNNTIIQNYYDTLSADMDMMNEDSKMYSELSQGLTESQVEAITQIAALEAEMQVYQSQGNTAKVAELKAQIEALKQGSEEENKGPQEEMDGLKENIETYTANNAEAAGVKTSGDTVANFLQAGDEFKTKALWIASLEVLAGVAAALPVIPWFPWEVGASALGNIASIAAALIFSTAAGLMFSNASTEGDAANAGDEMAGYLASLQENIDGQAGFTEATSGGYTETDTAATETVAENQEAANEANGKGPQGANGNGGNKPKPEEPPTGNVA